VNDRHWGESGLALVTRLVRSSGNGHSAFLGRILSDI
jgi:hypothetical protein